MKTKHVKGNSISVELTNYHRMSFICKLEYATHYHHETFEIFITR